MAHLCATVHKVYNANRRQKGGEDITTSSLDDSQRMKVISSSGGNAGLAVTTVATKIPDMDVSVVVPETTKPSKRGEYIMCVCVFGILELLSSASYLTLKANPLY